MLILNSWGQWKRLVLPWDNLFPELEINNTLQQIKGKWVPASVQPAEKSEL